MILRADLASNLEPFISCYQDSDSIPFVVIDDFLEENFANSLHQEIVSKINLGSRSSDYIFSRNKYEDPSFFLYGPKCRLLRDFFLSPDLPSLLFKITGKQLVIDPSFLGGGVHIGGPGSYLDMHVDFEGHPVNPEWRRYLNVILYMNKPWDASYGGCLEIINKESQRAYSIEPKFNRCVIMRTNSLSLHGYKPISFPEGQYRLSIAVYAYQLVSPDVYSHLRTTTKWYPDKGLIRKCLAKFSHKLVSAKQHIFGSSTASRARKIDI